MIKEISGALSSRKRIIIETDGGLKPAAVLAPLFYKNDCWNLLFTKRTDLVGSHKGQISFPGGGLEPGDRTLLDAALRESEEEIGLTPTDVEILGAGDDLITVTHFVVTPFFASIPYPYQFVPNDAEIDRIIEIPIETMLDPANVRTQAIVPEPTAIEDLMYYFYYQEDIVWGATARICAAFFSQVFDWKPPEPTLTDFPEPIKLQISRG